MQTIRRKHIISRAQQRSDCRSRPVARVRGRDSGTPAKGGRKPDGMNQLVQCFRVEVVLPSRHRRCRVELPVAIERGVTINDSVIICIVIERKATDAGAEVDGVWDSAQVTNEGSNRWPATSSHV